MKCTVRHIDDWKIYKRLPNKGPLSPVLWLPHPIWDNDFGNVLLYNLAYPVYYTEEYCFTLILYGTRREHAGGAAWGSSGICVVYF